MKALVIVVDAWHLGFTGCYGNDWIDTPFLDNLAVESAVFDRHYADMLDPLNLPASWWNELPHLSAEATSLPALLKSAGITAGLVSHRVSHAPWDHHQTRDGIEDWRSMLDQVAERDRWCLWLEHAGLMPPWDVPMAQQSRYLDSEDTLPFVTELPSTQLEHSNQIRHVHSCYAAAVSHFDEQLGAFLDTVADRGLLDDCLLMVTSDLGLGLGEHGVFGRAGVEIHEEVCHLPLILRIPGGQGSRVSHLTQPCDLMPTVLEWFGMASIDGTGRSLLPLLRDGVDAWRDAVVSVSATGSSVRTEEWALLRSLDQAESKLFVRPDDRWEMNDVRGHHHETFEELESMLSGAAPREVGS